ncbi:MAG: serine protease [Pseudomonadota bacterium]
MVKLPAVARAAVIFSLAHVLLTTNAAHAERQYLLSSPLSRPVVRVMANYYASHGQYGSGTGLLVGRCDVLVTARHVAEGPNGFQPSALEVYSPQIRGRVVDVVNAPEARAIWPEKRADAVAGNLDADLAVLRLSECPTHTSLPLDQLRALEFSDLKAMKTVGYPCDGRAHRGPEHVALSGQYLRLNRSLGLSRKIRLTPGARPGQSGSPIYVLKPGHAPAVGMILVATARDTATPIGCAQDPQTGQSEAGHAAFGAVLTTRFIENLRHYIRALNRSQAP